MKRGFWGLMLIVFFLFALAATAMGEGVEVMGGIGITGMPGVDGITFPDTTKQTTAVNGTLYQKRVTGNCSSGYAISAIDSTGAVVTCQVMGSGTVTGVTAGTGLTGGGAGGNVNVSLSTPVSVANGGTGSTNGSITGTGALTFTAGGTNTNVNLIPNGTGKVDVGSKRITNLATPTTSTDAATKGYVDTSALSGIPSGYSIMGDSATPPAGYTYTGLTSVETWLPKASMPTARAWLTATAVNNVIYAIGGQNDSGALATNEAYDPVANSWSTKASMPTARRFLAAVAVNNVIYGMGGLEWRVSHNQ